MRIKLLTIIIFLYLIAIVIKFSNIITYFKNQNESTTNIIISEFKPKYAKAQETENLEKSETELNSKKQEMHSKPSKPKFENSKNNKIKFEKPKEAEIITTNCTNIEIDILKTLAKRRKELEDWTRDAKNKEHILKTTEVKIENKLKELTKLKNQVNQLLIEYNNNENKKIEKLVKIYETMKPKDAAKIFEQLDMPILLSVLRRMKETKIAPILANINPQKAKDITTEILEKKPLT